MPSHPWDTWRTSNPVRSGRGLSVPCLCTTIKESGTQASCFESTFNKECRKVLVGYSDPKCRLFWRSRDCRLMPATPCTVGAALQIPSGARAPEGVSGCSLQPVPDLLAPLRPRSSCKGSGSSRAWEGREGEHAGPNSAGPFTSAPWHLSSQQSSFPGLRKTPPSPSAAAGSSFLRLPGARPPSSAALSPASCTFFSWSSSSSSRDIRFLRSALPSSSLKKMKEERHRFRLG